MIIRLNQKGLSYHVLIPVLAVMVVGGLGAYLATQSSARSLDSKASPYNCKVPEPTVRLGSTGVCVKALQFSLNQWIVYQRITANKLPVDGRFGSKTVDVVKRFQQRQGLPVDGVVGPKTWARLADGCGIRYSCK